MKSLKKIASDDRAVNQLQENMEQAINPVLKSQIIDGIIIKDVEVLTGTPKTINHLLGRAITGYAVIKRNASSQIWDSANDKRTLTLNSSANVTINLWVF